MIDYVESPIGRVVNVAWPADADPGIRLRGQGMYLPFVYWTSATNNGVVRIEFGIEISEFSALDIVVGDIAQCRVGGALVEEAEIIGLTDQSLGTLSWKQINARRIYLPRASWPIPPKPDRVEIRKASGGALVMFSDLTTPGWYSYTYTEFVGIPAPDDNNYIHEFTDTESPYS